ncbi:hypothetical protein [Bacillus thuringiensis]|uniref:Uncharacterized protein n=1 Tax=Bacillus thuringiensis subsp. higo TaxID=132266 RepID=A0A9X6LJZ9_BACUH|nr:hypothetical protein [Bacillus thuringiensis]OUB46737.1 hypothetical protein BK716_21000 [Bacillus thuringiensis serovar higo]OUB52728.1 hypothetical protein BK716_11865 [Bacillus thuringiensis serovar higo]
MGKYRYQELLRELQHVEHKLKGIERESNQTRSKKLMRRQEGLHAQYTSLAIQTNAGNLRHVVCSLYTERGLSMKEFANEIEVSESEIHDLIRKGMVTERLLDLICTYFQIQKTPVFMRYIQ